MEFEWDEAKNQSNFQKHKIWFEEARGVFYSPRFTFVDDREDYGPKFRAIFTP